MNKFTVNNSTISTVCCLFVLSLAFSAGCGAREVRASEDWAGVEVTGKLTDINGNPVSEGYLYAYSYGRSVLGPALAMSEPASRDGRYVLVVPPGKYTLVARKRLSGSFSGPLRNGDLTGRVEGVFTARSGAVPGVDVLLKVFKLGAAGNPAKILNTDTRVSGVIMDTDGKPIAGAHIFAYRDKLTRDPPDYLSSATGQDGRFLLSLPGGGRYVIGARTGLRGRPRDSDMVGFWDDPEKAKIIREGQIIENVELKLVPFGERIKLNIRKSEH